MSMSTSVDDTAEVATAHRRFFTRQPGIGASAAAKAVAEDVQTLARAEVDLAKAELSAAMQAKAMGAGFLVAAAVAGWLALQGLLITAGIALALVLPDWLAALIVTAVLLLVAAIAALLGRRKLSTPANLDETKRNVAEDIAVARARLGRG
jgi:uncharacterized membrane protein YqjE